jgi:hypothetical protein
MSNSDSRVKTAGAVFLLFLMAAFMPGCGLFSPREVETPVVPEDPDPLMFAQILSNSRSEIDFNRLDYEDMFNTNFIYVDNDDIEYSRRTFFGRLNNIRQSGQELFVSWNLTDTSDHEPVRFSNSEEAELQTRTYRIRSGDVISVTHNEESGESDTIYSFDMSGEAFFRLVYDLGINSWTIAYWRDIPYGDGNEKSFFHPYY